MVRLILGGARSGKSRLAERLAHESGLAVTYIATATAQDDEMRQRIAMHQARRPVDWRLIEEPLALADTLQREAAENRCLLVDCVTLWLTNVVLTNDDAYFARERAALLKCLPTLPGQIIVVSNETGMGIVPLGALTRRFCDEAGWLNQDLAANASDVIFTIAGLPLFLKGHAS